MYKVFINEKKLLLSKFPESTEKNIPYEGIHSIEIALDCLENTTKQEVNIFGENINEIWSAFKSFFKIIEAAGGIVKNSEGKVLFIQRLGRWDLPKGKIEVGETYELAAIREVEEETQLSQLTLGEAIATTYHIYKEKNGTKVLKMTHWFHMLHNGNETPVPQVEEGITDVQWLDEEDIYFKVLPNTFKNIQLILGEAGILK